MPSPPPGLGPILLAMAGLSALSVGFVGAVVVHHRSRRRAEAEQARTQALLLEAARAGRLVLWAWEPGRGLTLSASAEAVLDPVPESLDGLLAQLGPQEAAVRAWLEASSDGQPLRVQSGEGEGRHLAWELRRAGTRLDGVIRDITQEVRLQAQLLQSQKLEAVGTLVSGVSHEFGNLLMTVDACVDGLVRDEGLPADQREAARLIQDAAVRGKDLIRQLSGFARRGAGVVRLEDPAKLLEELARMLGPLFGRRIQVQVDVTPGLRPHPLDRAQVLQALLNLCLNARDAMPRGGTLRLGAHRDGGDLVLDVDDEGPGVPPDLVARIFEPFFTTKEPGKGTGLGLAVTQSLVQGQGGTLSCERAPGGGARFRMRWATPSHPR